MDAEAFLREWIGLIRGVWPEIPGMDEMPRQMYTSVQALKVSVVEKLRATPPQVALPLVVIRYGVENHDGGWDVTGSVFRAPFGVYRVEATTTPQYEIHEEMVALRDAVEAADLAGTLVNFQTPHERPTIDTSDGNDVNSALMAEGIRVTSGQLEYSPGLFLR